MKIEIVTFQHANNYGALYQAYALSNYLRLKGHDVFILDYKLIPKIDSRRLNKKLTFKKIFDKICKIVTKGHHNKFIPLFDDFRANHLILSDEKYCLIDLIGNYPVADAYICGSDQIWNTDYLSFSEGYLLSFLPNHIKRIAYAPSFGNDKLNGKYVSTFKKELEKFSSISVREKSGCDIVKKLLNRDVEHVLDPTLLFQDYNDIIDYSMVPKEPYILVYRLHQNYKLTERMTRYIKNIAKQTKMPIYSISPKSIYLHKEIGVQITPTPGQLLGLIMKAKLFITNSFHGTVFAINFRTQFLVMPRDEFPDKQNLRLNELLGNTDLKSRFVNYDQNIFNHKTVFNEIDWDNSYSKLEVYRNKSENFLSNALVKNK